MSNIYNPQGLVPVDNFTGESINRARTYYVPSTDTNQYNVGDAVMAVAADDGAGVPVVTKYATGNRPRGVFTGVAPITAGNSMPNTDQVGIPASKSRGYYVLVVEDPNEIFEIAEFDTGGAQLTSVNIGANIELKINAANSIINGASTMQLDPTTVATTATLPFRLIGLSSRVVPPYGATNAYGANAVWLVACNNHDFKSGVTGL